MAGREEGEGDRTEWKEWGMVNLEMNQSSMEKENLSFVRTVEMETFQ